MHKDGSLPKLFISYSKDDVDSKNTLLKHLAGLRNKFVPWNDQDMLPGENWDECIKAKLHSADVVLYLVSHNSIATDYIQNVELPITVQRYQNKECALIPVIIDFCHWTDLGFSIHNALPNKGLPVTDRSWVNQNEAWLKVVQGIKRIIEKVSVDMSSITQPNIIIPETKPVIIAPVIKAEEDWQIIDNYRVKEGLAIDTNTGLMWLRFAYGQTWQNGTTQGVAKALNWEDSFKAAKDFNTAGGYLGYNDWQLPAIDELKTLIDKVKGKKGNYIHPDVFPNNGAVFWSSSPDASNGSYASSVLFDSGYAYWLSKGNDFQVRLVRSGQ